MQPRTFNLRGSWTCIRKRFIGQRIRQVLTHLALLVLASHWCVSSGGWATAVGFKEYTRAAGPMIKSAIDSLLEKCLEAPLAPCGRHQSAEHKGAVKMGKLDFDSTLTELKS